MKLHNRTSPWITTVSLLAVLAVVLLLPDNTVYARGVYQEPDTFVLEAFNGQPPATRILWLTSDIRPVAEKILSHKPTTRRVRYWASGQRSVWVLDEIGKDQPITVGIIVNQGKLEKIKILVFRESRGDEVRYPSFTDQFTRASLTDKYQLNQTVDGISGATLSVRAVKKLSRLALYYHNKIIIHDSP